MRCRDAPPILIYILAGALGAASVPAGAAHAGDPVQWWNAFAYGLKFAKSSLDTKAETRLAEGGDILDWNLEGHLLVKAGERFSWGPGFKYEQKRDPGDAFAVEHRFAFTGLVKLSASSSWKTSLRGRYEYRDLEDRPNAWRFRLRPEVRRALGGSAWDLAASEEVFYDSAQDRIDQNRLQIGAEHPLGGKVALLIYYMARSDRRDGRWEETQILGTTWKFHR